MVPYTEKVMDLGVWISSDLKPSFHCQQIAAKAKQTLDRIKCSFEFCLVVLSRFCIVLIFALS